MDELKKLLTSVSQLESQKPVSGPTIFSKSNREEGEKIRRGAVQNLSENLSDVECDDKKLPKTGDTPPGLVRPIVTGPITGQNCKNNDKMLK